MIMILIEWKKFKLDLKTNILATKDDLITKRVLNETSYPCLSKIYAF